MRQSTTRLKHGCFKARFALLVLAALALAAPMQSRALPIFARQTGQNCIACHAGGQFPELNAYGRMFKMTGYTLGKRTIPLAVFGVIDYTKTKNTGGTDDRSANFPKDGELMFDTASIFLAGKIIDNAGLFAEGVYDFHYLNSKGQWVGHFSTGNVDVRVADRLISPQRDLVFGASLNNNPTIEDPWNSTPTWGYPYITSAFAIAPATTPLISGGLTHQVAGLTAYGYWNKMIYLALGAYQSATGPASFLSEGIDNASRVKINGTSPYWRFALTHAWGAHDLMVGAFGMNTNLYPGDQNTSGLTGQYRDIGFDTQYQYILDPHAFTAQASYIDETIHWAGSTLLNGAVSNRSDSVHQFNLKGTYAYQAKYGADLAYFNIGGSADAALYPGAQLNDAGNPVPIRITGSVNNNPGTSGWIAELFWKPIQYVRIGAQYWLYNRFNGGSGNYDGNGRSASDNNTLYVYVWAAY